MSRHRNVRSMNYTDEYDGYDDVYGHSVEDDYCVSPSQAAFMYDREGPKAKPKIGAFLDSDIAEENEEPEGKESNLSELDRARLESCIDHVKRAWTAPLTRPELVDLALLCNFNAEKSLRLLTDSKPAKPPEKGTPTVLKEPAPETPKVIITNTKTNNVTKGFDLATRLTPRSQSPASGRATPINEPPDDKKQKKAADVAAQYKNERANEKDHLYMVVVGHVDAGKSTLMGHLLYDLGQINQKTMHKYEQESRKLGKQSFMYAWVLDETGEERTRGITMDVGRSQFETESKQVTLLDAPGHKDFIPNMISGAGQADVALLVVDATRGEFETGFDYGGQTREHALLVRSLGVSQLAVAVNKLDTVSWSEGRFNEIVVKLRTFLKQAGFKENDVTFVPCSGLTGQNLVGEPSENELLVWYKGPCLLNVINNFRSPDRPILKPLRLSINDIFKGTGSNFCASGRLETGSLSTGDQVLICPSRETATVKALTVDETPRAVAFAGDQVSVTLTGVDMQNVSVGYVICDPGSPVQVASKFQARIVVFNVNVPLTKGFPIVLHNLSLVEPATIGKLLSLLNKSTGEVVKKHPRCLLNNSSAMIEVHASKAIAIEAYGDCKEMGRIMIRVGGVTIAAGLITKVL